MLLHPNEWLVYFKWSNQRSKKKQKEAATCQKKLISTETPFISYGIEIITIIFLSFMRFSFMFSTVRIFEISVLLLYYEIAYLLSFSGDVFFAVLSVVLLLLCIASFGVLSISFVVGKIVSVIQMLVIHGKRNPVGYMVLLLGAAIPLFGESVQLSN